MLLKRVPDKIYCNSLNFHSIPYVSITQKFRKSVEITYLVMEIKNTGRQEIGTLPKYGLVPILFLTSEWTE